MPEAEVQRLKDISKRAELNDKYAQLNDAHAAFEGSGDGSLGNDMLDEDDIEREVGRVADDVMLAEEDEVESKESMLLSSVQSMGESVTSYLMQVFGYEDDSLDDDDTAMTDTSADIELSEEQLDVIAKKISDRLAVDVKSDFRKKADDIAEGKVSEIDMVVAEDKGLRVSAQEVRSLFVRYFCVFRPGGIYISSICSHSKCVDWARYQRGGEDGIGRSQG